VFGWLTTKTRQGLAAELHVTGQRRVELRDRLLQRERDFPNEKRELCLELVETCRDLFQSTLDWRGPVINRTLVEEDIRRLLRDIDAINPNITMEMIQPLTKDEAKKKAKAERIAAKRARLVAEGVLKNERLAQG
jgi:hypothetical protein